MEERKTPKCVLAHRLSWLLKLTAVGLALLFLSPLIGDIDLALPILGLLMLSGVGMLTAQVSVVCPHCGASLYRGLRQPFFLPRNCPSCGETILKDDD